MQPLVVSWSVAGSGQGPGLVDLFQQSSSARSTRRHRQPRHQLRRRPQRTDGVLVRPPAHGLRLAAPLLSLLAFAHFYGLPSPRSRPSVSSSVYRRSFRRVLRRRSLPTPHFRDLVEHGGGVDGVGESVSEGMGRGDRHHGLWIACWPGFVLVLCQASRHRIQANVMRTHTDLCGYANLKTFWYNSASRNRCGSRGQSTVSSSRGALSVA